MSSENAKCDDSTRVLTRALRRRLSTTSEDSRADTPEPSLRRSTRSSSVLQRTVIEEKAVTASPQRRSTRRSSDISDCGVVSSPSLGTRQLRSRRTLSETEETVGIVSTPVKRRETRRSLIDEDKKNILKSLEDKENVRNQNLSADKQLVIASSLEVIKESPRNSPTHSQLSKEKLTDDDLNKISDDEDVVLSDLRSGISNSHKRPSTSPVKESSPNKIARNTSSETSSAGIEIENNCTLLKPASEELETDDKAKSDLDSTKIITSIDQISTETKDEDDMQSKSKDVSLDQRVLVTDNTVSSNEGETVNENVNSLKSPFKKIEDVIENSDCINTSGTDTHVNVQNSPETDQLNDSIEVFEKQKQCTPNSSTKNSLNSSAKKKLNNSLNISSSSIANLSKFQIQPISTPNKIDNKSSSVDSSPLKTNTSHHMSPTVDLTPLKSNTSHHKSPTVNLTPLKTNTSHHMSPTVDLTQLKTNTSHHMSPTVDLTPLKSNTSHHKSPTVNLTSLKTNTSHHMSPTVNLTSLKTNTSHHMSPTVDLTQLKTNTSHHMSPTVDLTLLKSNTSHHKSPTVDLTPLKSNTSHHKSPTVDLTPLKSNTSHHKSPTVDSSPLKDDNTSLVSECSKNLRKSFDKLEESPTKSPILDSSPLKSNTSHHKSPTIDSSPLKDNTSLISECSINLRQSFDKLEESPTKSLILDSSPLKSNTNTTLKFDKFESPIGKHSEQSDSELTGAEDVLELRRRSVLKSPKKSLDKKDDNIKEIDSDNCTPLTLSVEKSVKKDKLSEENVDFLKSFVNIPQKEDETSEQSTQSNLSVNNSEVEIQLEEKATDASDESTDVESDTEIKTKHKKFRKTSSTFSNNLTDSDNEMKILRKKRTSETKTTSLNSDSSDLSGYSNSDRNKRKTKRNSEKIDSNYIENEAIECSGSDSPSTGSNDIIEVGDSIGESDSIQEHSSDYEKDSFVVFDEIGDEMDLLSGTGDDLSEHSGNNSDIQLVSQSKAHKKAFNEKFRKKSRIIHISDDSSDESITFITGNKIVEHSPKVVENEIKQNISLNEIVDDVNGSDLNETDVVLDTNQSLESNNKLEEIIPKEMNLSLETNIGIVEIETFNEEKLSKSIEYNQDSKDELEINENTSMKKHENSYKMNQEELDESISFNNSIISKKKKKLRSLNSTPKSVQNDTTNIENNSNELESSKTRNSTCFVATPDELNSSSNKTKKNKQEETIEKDVVINHEVPASPLNISSIDKEDDNVVIVSKTQDIVETVNKNRLNSSFNKTKKQDESIILEETIESEKDLMINHEASPLNVSSMNTMDENVVIESETQDIVETVVSKKKKNNAVIKSCDTNIEQMESEEVSTIQEINVEAVTEVNKSKKKKKKSVLESEIQEIEEISVTEVNKAKKKKKKSVLESEIQEIEEISVTEVNKAKKKKKKSVLESDNQETNVEVNKTKKKKKKSVLGSEIVEQMPSAKNVNKKKKKKSVIESDIQDAIIEQMASVKDVNKKKKKKTITESEIQEIEQKISPSVKDEKNKKKKNSVSKLETNMEQTTLIKEVDNGLSNVYKEKKSKTIKKRLQKLVPSEETSEDHHKWLDPKLIELSVKLPTDLLNNSIQFMHQLPKEDAVNSASSLLNKRKYPIDGELKPTLKKMKNNPVNDDGYEVISLEQKITPSVVGSTAYDFKRQNLFGGRIPRQSSLKLIDQQLKGVANTKK